MTRRRFMSMCGLGFLAGTIKIVHAFAARPMRATTIEQPDQQVVECRIAIVCDKGMDLELHLTDDALIRELVEQPLKAAKVDPKPALYQLMGSLTLHKKNGTKSDYVLFYPWGYYHD